MKAKYDFFPFSFLFLIGLSFFPFAPAHAESETAQRSIVGIKAEIPNSARTAKLLGNQRVGTGIVLDSSGLVVTIGYVILEAKSIQILDTNGQEVPATLVGYHAETGFGLVRSILELQAPPIQLGSSAALSTKAPVTVLTHAPQPATHEATVADRKTFAGYWEYLLENAIYTVPPISPFAGAALINEEGLLIGVGSLVLREAVRMNGQSIPGNLFVPIDELKPILHDLEKNGKPSRPQRPWLGLFLTEKYGRVEVARVYPSSPAQQAGMATGDIILKINETPVDGLETLYRNLWKMGTSGTKIPLTRLHHNSIEKLTVISGNRYDHYRFSHIF